MATANSTGEVRPNPAPAVLNAPDFVLHGEALLCASALLALMELAPEPESPLMEGLFESVRSVALRLDRAADAYERATMTAGRADA